MYDFNIYKINGFMLRQAFIAALTWFISYFYIRKLLNPYNWKYNMDEIFIESLFGSFAMFMMLIMNFIFFKFFDCNDTNNTNKNDDKIMKRVELTYNHT
jgi:hypothetical protein